MEYVPDAVLSAAVGALNKQHGTSTWETPSAILSPTCFSDHWMLSFIQDCRRLALTRPLDAILFPRRINLKGFMVYTPTSPTRPSPRIHALDLERALDNATANSITAATEPHPLVELITALCDQANMTSVLERLGFFVLAQRIIAWQANPTRASHATLPEAFAPRPSQLTVPHPQWVDLIFPGSLRDIVIERQDIYATEEFQRVYASSLRLVNWPCRPVDALQMDETGEIMWLTDAFVAHALQLGNWSMDKAFSSRYPELQGLVATAG